MDGLIMEAFSNPLSLHIFDLMMGIAVGSVIRLAVYLKEKMQRIISITWNTVHHGGANLRILSLLWIKSFRRMILSQTERITMNSRPSHPNMRETRMY